MYRFKKAKSLNWHPCQYHYQTVQKAYLTGQLGSCHKYLSQATLIYDMYLFWDLNNWLLKLNSANRGKESVFVPRNTVVREIFAVIKLWL